MAQVRQTTGMKVAAMARDLTGAQIGELIALKANQLIGVECPILSSYGRDDCHKPLIRRRLIEWLAPAEPWGPGWRQPRITNLGERVLLARCEQELDHLFPKYEPDPE